jgi:transposase-like protein
MGVPRKQYSREFKLEAVRLVTEGGLSIAQAARDLGLNDNLLSRWKKEVEQNSQRAFPGHGQPQDEELARLRREQDEELARLRREQDEELARLRRENEVLRREREILDIVFSNDRQVRHDVCDAL